MLTYGVHELESGGIIPYFTGNTKIIEGDTIIARRMNGDYKTFHIGKTNLEYATVIKKAKKWASRIWDINPSKNDDGSYPVLHDKGTIGGLLKGFFGYNGDPSLVGFIVWLLSIIGLNYLYQKIGRKKV